MNDKDNNKIIIEINLKILYPIAIVVIIVKNGIITQSRIIKERNLNVKNLN